MDRPATDPEADAFWDHHYAGDAEVWSGQPNAALVTEVQSLTPGTALDVGCGEGADAVWLARRGWAVTALDVSQVALARAEQRSRDAGASVTWLHTGLAEAALPDGGFDLVSAQYPALPRRREQDVVARLLSAVRVGGVLLVVHHAEVDLALAREHGFDPADYVLVHDVAAALDDAWVVEVDEVRDRHVPGGAGAHHDRDQVLRARRVHRAPGPSHPTGA